jgi:hypothetical protein
VCPRIADDDGIVQREGTGEILGRRHSALHERLGATLHFYYTAERKFSFAPSPLRGFRCLRI